MINRKIHTNWLKKLICRHKKQVHLRNIYGDEINAAGGNRSWWLCVNCGQERLKPELYNPLKALGETQKS
jgi:hypothetical protein